MKKLLMTLVCLSLALFPALAASRHFFQTVDVKDGLADNFVRDIMRDSYGYIWISTINGVSRYDGYRLVNYMPQVYGGISNDVLAVRETADSTLWMSCVGMLLTYQRAIDGWKNDGAERLARLGIEGTLKLFYVDDGGDLWVTTELGLYHYDYSDRRLHHISHYGGAPIKHIVSRDETTLVVTSDYKIYKVGEKENKLLPLTQAPTVTDSRDYHLFFDSHANLWFYYSHGMVSTQWVYSLTQRQWHPINELVGMADATLNVIAEDHDGNLWICSGNRGIGLFSRQESGLAFDIVRYEYAFQSHNSHISCIFLDNTNTLWVGSAKLGVAFTDLNSPDFNQISTGEHEDVSALVEDSQGNLWIGFDGGGVMKKSPEGATTFFSAASQQLPSDIVTSLLTRSDGTVLVGTYGNGIARLEGNRFVPLYPHASSLRYVKAMAYDTHGNLWVATVDNGVAMVTTSGKVANFTAANSPISSNGTLCLVCDSLRDCVYIGTSVGITIYDCAKKKFIKTRLSSKLKSSYITSLMIGHGHQIWVGSRDGLWVCNPEIDSLVHLTTEQGLSHNVVRALTGNRNGLWASTDNGLTYVTYNGKEYECHPFFDSDGLHDVLFTNNAALTTRKGDVLLGSFSGYLSIRPELVTINYPRMHVSFTEFRINGKTVAKSISDFTIQHDERLGISLSVMTPSLTRNVRYMYRFKGEKEWLRAPSNMLYFATLMPGTHVLQVKALLGSASEPADAASDEQGPDISELTIQVLPPFWQSKWAIAFYLLLLAAFIYFIYRLLKRRQKREIAIKQLEVNLKKYEMEEEKISFFTNISHDIKTPLTMVIAPLEKIRETPLPAYIHTELDVAWQNARQLYDLVLELLDFRRIDVGKEKLNLSHGDLVDFVRQTVEGFAYYAARKQIKMQLNLPPAPVETLFDENKMRRIVTNLLSNACKYNVDHGSVTVTMDVSEKAGDDSQMVLSVADTGIGVRDKNHIFDRFVQESHGQEQEGSGLGLHIVRQYVDLMGGSISVADNEPMGTIFTVTLPLRDAVSDEKEESEIQEVAATAVSPQSKPAILVVEDNTDARHFLQRSLESDYRVFTAANGKDALHQLAKADSVSLIISDVMMPEMDGMELVRQVKKNIRYSHIPIIMLTAKSSEESIVAGLEEGVADYVTKPFSLAVLRLRIQKIIEWTQSVHKQIATGIAIKPSEITVSSLDQEFIERVIADIEAHIGDSQYSVVQLSSAVNMTRGNLYKKLMAIAGKSPVEFIRIVRLERGKNLLAQGRTNISEVADMVGISPKLFSQYFKQMYGDSPSEYLKKKKKRDK